MRCLIVIGDMHPTSGGAPQVIAHHALELAKRNAPVEIVSTYGGRYKKNRDLWPELSRVGIRLSIFPRLGPKCLGFSPVIYRYLVQHIRDFDVVHLHGVWDHCLAWAAKLAHGASIPYVVTPHGMLDQWSMMRSRWGKKVASVLFGTKVMLRGAAGLHYATLEEAQEAEELGLNARQFIIPNGVDVAQWAVRRKESRKELCRLFPRLEHAAPLVVFFARFHIKKGPDLLLDAFAQLRHEFPSVGLLLAGIRDDMVLEKRLRRRVEGEDLNGHAYVTTELVGARGKIALGGADLFVLPSRQEGFSVAVLQAMACGLPVVITDRCHFDLIARAGAGAVVGATLDELTQGLREMLSHSQGALAEMGARGSALIAKEYAWEPIGEQLFCMYKTVVAEQGA